MKNPSCYLTKEEFADLLGVKPLTVLNNSHYYSLSVTIKHRVCWHEACVRQILQEKINKAREAVDFYSNALERLELSAHAPSRSSGKRLFYKDGNWLTCQDLIKYRKQHQEATK
jgi:hypothetical protein